MVIFNFNNLKEKIEKRKKWIINREIRRLKRQIKKEIKNDLLYKFNTSTKVSIAFKSEYNDFKYELCDEILEYFSKNVKYKGISFVLHKTYYPYLEIELQ